MREVPAVVWAVPLDRRVTRGSATGCEPRRAVPVVPVVLAVARKRRAAGWRWRARRVARPRGARRARGEWRGGVGRRAAVSRRVARCAARSRRPGGRFRGIVEHGWAAGQVAVGEQPRGTGWPRY